nr:hypothetical protein [uncultured bacterium]
MRLRDPRLHALVMIAACLGACRSKQTPEQQAAPASSASSGPVKSSRGLEPNLEFWAELEAVAAKCTYLEKKDTLSCASSTLEPLKSKIGSEGPMALETLLAAVFDGSPRLAALAGPQMRNAYERSLGPALEQAPIPEHVVSALIAALSELPSTVALRVAPAAAFVASREGRLDELMQIVERRRELRAVVLPRVMRYARLGALGDVKKWVTSDDEEAAAGAVDALRLMEDWTADERKQLTPWLKELLSHGSNKVRGKAASFLLECDDEPAAQALAWFNAALDGKQLTRDAVYGFGRHCHPENRAAPAEQRATLASSPLCSKIELALDRVAADERSEGSLREAALEAMVTVWPKRARQRAETLTKHSDGHLAQIADNVIKIAGDDKTK